ncbi:MAG: hypothetical protein ACW98Y_11550 [Candidatus Thorarchaeota archaeon]|jgi:hypothetical protein
MSDDYNFSHYEYVGKDPYSKKPDIVAYNSEGVRFILNRTKRKKSYTEVFDIEWSEVISFECCEVSYGKDDKSWPLDEEQVDDIDFIGEAGMVFFFIMIESNTFQIWSYIPHEDVIQVRNAIEEYVGRPQLPRLAHHGNSAAVKLILDSCSVRERIRTTWHDWIKTGPRLGKPREKKWRERGPDYVFCEEGLAIDFYGAGEMLEQMSTFWPWRLISNIMIDDYHILYQWFDDTYVFRQQVWDKEERRKLLEVAKDAYSSYHASDEVEEFLSIRPWSFPSYFMSTWEKLEPLLCKASRNRFPPIFDFVEE